MSTVVGQAAGRRRRESRIGAAAAGVDAFSKTRTTRLIGLAVAAVVGRIRSLVVIATPAAAALSGLIRVSKSTGINPGDFKIVTVDCPAGKQLVGTGAQIPGGLGEVVITSLQPNGSPTDAPTRVTAVAQETDPLSSNWRLIVYGICANPLPGLVRISATSSAKGSENFKSVTAVCPAGKEMVGTGFENVDEYGWPTGRVTVDWVRPITVFGNGQSPYAVQVDASETDAYSGNWWLKAYAICATPPAGLWVINAQSANNAADGKTAKAQCPAHKRMLGTAVSIHGPVGAHPFGQIVLSALVPNGSPTTAPSSVLATAYEEDSVTENWVVVANAFCADV